MRSVADMSKLYELAGFLINERGYIVVGLRRGSYASGQITQVLWNVAVDQPMRVICETDFEDWKEQCHLAMRTFPDKFKQEFYKDKSGDAPMTNCGRYYRVITD